MENFLSDKQIIELLNSQYGFEILDIILLDKGADINASIYVVKTKQQNYYFVKLSANHNKIAILELLKGFGIEQIILPVKTIDKKSFLRINTLTMIVYPFIDGIDGFVQSLRDDQWESLGKALRKIHGINVPQTIQDNIRRETFAPLWRETLLTILARNKNDHIDDEISSKLWAYIKQNMNIINRLIERSAKLAEILSKKPHDFVLCHSDLHGGNILIDQKNDIYIVDWDSPIMAPKERDLMFIGGGVGNVWNRPDEEKLFYQGYGNTSIDITALAYYRHERIVEDIVEFCQEILFTNKNIDEKLVMYAHFVAMFASRGVIEIAFETDKNI